MNFDEPIDRRNTHSDKWDSMYARYGVSPDDGIAMWVADMDFRSPQCVIDAVAAQHAHGVFGYFGDQAAYRAAICWWMKTRHDWTVDAESIFTTHGLVNGTALCIESFTQPCDGVVLFTPVYHAFARVIKASGREVVECPLKNNAGRYEMDFAAYDAQMTGRERLLLLCSPHNPCGRVWSKSELQDVADFARRHDLILVSDEVHHDLVFGDTIHTPMANIDPTVADRLVILSAASKTFNIAGNYSGNVIIADQTLRARFANRMKAFGISANAFGLHMTTAAYSPDGAKWVNALNTYLDGNRQLLDAGLNAIPGVRSMEMQATHLAWVDFAGTGMSAEEFTARVEKRARIAVSHGPGFGLGGETFLRFNFATQRARLTEAVERMQDAFSDLQ
ncbi:MAG: MalY/PatB family protein [Paracoccaceae bacterium]